MPSPFPGMDPYLEDPASYPGLHNRLIIEISNTLQTTLPPAYYAVVGQRVWIEYPERHGEPDGNKQRSPRVARKTDHGPNPVQRSVPVADVDVSTPGVETTEIFVKIHTVGGDQSLVTTIEVLSLSNKRSGEGREQYRLKQQERLESRVNLVEIDLLRGGQHTTAVPHGRAVDAVGPFDYHVCIRATENLERRKVYGIRLEQSLPSIAVPLLPGDPLLPLDLQAIFSRAYEFGSYAELYPVTKPNPPLTPEQAAWATKLLREKGLLPAE